jgi:hypothetical protein
MQTMRESWTDERLDDLKESINERFDQVDVRFSRVEAQMAEGFARVDSDLREIRRTMYQGFIAVITVMVSCFFGLAGLLFLL